MTTGETKTASGKIAPTKASDELMRFIRTKFSPQAGTVVNALSGKTMIGERYRLDEKTTLLREIERNLTPMVYQDVKDAIEFQGLSAKTMIPASAAFLGVGVQTYLPSKWTEASEMKNKLSQETFGEEWDNLTDIEQKRLSSWYPGIGNLEREAKFEQETAPDLKRMMEFQNETEREVTLSLSNNVQKELENTKTRIGGISKSLGDWNLNDKRFDRYKTILTTELNKRLQTTIVRKDYKEGNESVKQRRLDFIISATKEYANKKIKIEAARERAK